MSALLLAAQADTVRLTAQTRIIAAVLAIAFMFLVLELIRRDRLQERYSVIWFVAGLGMLAGAAFPGLLQVVADAMGVRDTNVALFSIVLFFLLGLALNFSVIMSRQAAQITRLAQERALEQAPAGSRRGASGERRPSATSRWPGEQRLEAKKRLSSASSSETLRSRLRRASATSSAPRRAAAGSRPCACSRRTSRRSLLKTTSSAPAASAARSRSQAAQSSSPRSRISVRRRRAGALGLVGEVLGAAFDPRLGVGLERRPGRRLGLLAGRLGPRQQRLPGSAGDLAGERRRQRPLDLGPQRPPRLGEQQPPPLEVAGREPRRRRDLLGPTGRFRRSPGEIVPSASGAAASSASRTAAGSGVNSTVWQREATVSSSASGSELSRIRWTNSGGSSSVFSSAFWLSSRIASAASTTKTRLPPSKGR